MSQLKNILVIGGSGFLGNAVCNQLAKAGHFITVPTRRIDHAKHLLPLPTCKITQANIHDRANLSRLVAGHDIVINLLGVLQSKRGKPYGQAFRTNHVEFPKALCAVMAKHAVKRLIHISALGVGVQNPAPSMYLRSKTDGEAAVKDSGLLWTTLRPSAIFGPQDKFLNLFAKLCKITPIFPLTSAQTKMQPVSVSDVAQAVLACVEDKTRFTIHATFDLVGPEVFTLKQLVELSGHAIGETPRILSLPDSLGKIMATFLGLVPGQAMITRDNINSMRVNNVHTSGKIFPLQRYESLSVVAPEYIKSKYKPSELDKFRQTAHREG
jgi:uncharacterized protein YbjT (DUF2867 family)